MDDNHEESRDLIKRQYTGSNVLLGKISVQNYIYVPPTKYSCSPFPNDHLVIRKHAMPLMMFVMLQKLWNKLPKVRFLLVFSFMKLGFCQLAYQLLLLLSCQEVSRKVGLLRFTLISLLH